MFTLKSAVIASSLIILSLASVSQASARQVWYGPGSGAFSPYANFKGWAQVPRQNFQVAPPVRYNATSPQPYRCVPNVGLVGADGICRN